MSSLLQNTDLLLFNRNDVTYKGTVQSLSDHIILELSDGSGNLVLDSLGDVSTGNDGPNPADQGKFLIVNPTGQYVPVSFRNAVDTEIQLYLSQNPQVGGASRIFTAATQPGLLDVDQQAPDAANRYTKTILLGQNYAAGSGEDEFRAVDFDTEVSNVIINFFNPNSPDFGGIVVPEVLNDLRDVQYSATIQRGDILRYLSDADGEYKFREVSLEESVIEIINNGDSTINIKPANLPKAAYFDEAGLGGASTDALLASGIVAVRKHAGTADDPQYLSVESIVTPGGTPGTTVLDVQIPNIPEVFQYVGPIYFNEAGNPFSDEAGTVAFAGPATALKGDIFVALPTDGGASDPVDPTVKRELLGWDSASIDDGVTGVNVARGSLVVCTLAGTGTSSGNNGGPQFAVMGELDYTPVDPTLQIVLDTGNTASNKNIELTNGSVELTMGNFQTTQGNLTTQKGAVYTEEGFIYTNKGSIRINGAYDAADPLINILSVPNIDFNRFPDIADAP